MDSENKVLRVQASVYLRTTDEGGRLTSLANSYMPHLKICGIDGFGRFKIGDNKTLAPGTCTVLELALVGSPLFIAQV